MSLKLNEPVKKKLKFYRTSSLYSGKPAFPLVIGSESEQIYNEDIWFISTGRFNGLSVIIDDQEEMKVLHTMGFFGKGCLSKRVPNFEALAKGAPIIKVRQWKRRKEWSKSAENLMDESKEQEGDSDSEPGNKKRKISDNIDDEGAGSLRNQTVCKINEIVVITDSDTEEDFMNRLNPCLEKEDIKTVSESLHLCLEEAFFLSYGIGCLQVIDLLGNLLPIATLWNIFRQTDPSFVENYVAYHYFRAKGWVVKSGMQFGGQFILYKKGPVFYHSSYIVIVEVYNPGGKRAKTDSNLFKLTNLSRLAETSFKEVLICEVHRPDVTDKEMKHPSVLPKFTVKENLIRRWLPNQEREPADNMS